MSLLVFIATSLFFIPSASAAVGDLDTSFDTDGKVTTAIGSGLDAATSIALQSDGKIVVAGQSVIGGNDDFAVVRYNTDGSLDTSFGTDGKVTTAIGAGSDAASSIALQSDGKIVVAGYSVIGGIKNFAVVRYNTNGSLDTSFGTGGKVTTAIGNGGDIAYSIALQSDGKIVVAGYSLIAEFGDFSVVRYNTNGSLDTSFGTGGKVTTAIGAGNDFANSMALQSDGKIVVVGYYDNGDNLDFVVVRYIASDSSLDASEVARVAARAAEAARKAKEQRELTEILALIPKIGELTLSLGETTKSLYSTKCVKGKTTKYVKYGAKCPKGYVKK